MDILIRSTGNGPAPGPTLTAPLRSSGGAAPVALPNEAFVPGEVRQSSEQLFRGFRGMVARDRMVSQMGAGELDQAFGGDAERVRQLGQTQSQLTAGGAKELLSQNQTAEVGKQRDEEALAHVCGAGCGCISGPSGKPSDVIGVFEKRDAEVREHENQHLVNAGEHAIGGPVFETYTASNGKTFITGGKVQVDLEESSDPLKTLEKMNKIKKAALAPASPSDQDRNVEAEASRKAAVALAQLQQQ